ncbi:hypothetical protein ANN_26113 [Periplaneta americana]|uniref:Uncharacterized protein n=1 Tax=Periplaneta americana TaxID=6978 RepID=A0ABQ8S5D3_PERAM|nr:hypothetical protein ANN_26113 [Periplaneta americana]
MTQRINETRNTPVTERVKQKWKSILFKNNGYGTLYNINCELVDIESPENKGLFLRDCNDVRFFRFGPITSCDVERSLSQYKLCLADNRKRFMFEREISKLNNKSGKTRKDVNICISRNRINGAIDKLNEDIDSIVTWTKKFHLNINPGKTQAIILGHKRQTDAVKQLDISPLNFANFLKHLKKRHDEFHT